MNFIKNVLLFLWQLPQNVLGLTVILVVKAQKTPKYANVYIAEHFNFGVSLGNFIIFGCKDYGIGFIDVQHERGHTKQSLYLGPLYLLLIGLPSVTFNIYDRLFHKKWYYMERYDWYYALPWEAWADRLGHVKR